MYYLRIQLMKTILATTDFSTPADNAVRYAAEIANRLKSKLILLHTYHAPLIASEAPVILPSLDEIESASKDALRKMEVNLQAHFVNISSIELHVKCGFAAEEIQELAEVVNADLIIMGMRGAGIIEQKLIGSVTTSVMKKVLKPLLVIDEHVSFSPVKNIVFACDYERMEKVTGLNVLRSFIKLFHSQLHVLNVVEDLTVMPSYEKAVNGVRLSSEIDDLNPSFDTIESDDVIEGINNYINQQNIDLLVMMPGKHTFFKNLFYQSHTQKMAFNTKIPLLCIH
jgi:nucleotide-binding universal stress UspA family protein